MTPGWWRAMASAIMPDGAVYNVQQNIISNNEMAKPKVSDLLNVESQIPLAWSKKIGGGP